VAAIIPVIFRGGTHYSCFGQKVFGFRIGLSFPKRRDCCPAARVAGKTSAGMVRRFRGEIIYGEKK
jgi:hypothetical protein